MFRLPKRADNPFKMGLDPGLDMCPELESDAASHLQTIISVLRLMTELERLGMIMEVSLSLLLALP